MWGGILHCCWFYGITEKSVMKKWTTPWPSLSCVNEYKRKLTSLFQWLLWKLRHLFKKIKSVTFNSFAGLTFTGFIIELILHLIFPQKKLPACIIHSLHNNCSWSFMKKGTTSGIIITSKTTRPPRRYLRFLLLVSQHLTICDTQQTFLSKQAVLIILARSNTTDFCARLSNCHEHGRDILLSMMLQCTVNPLSTKFLVGKIKNKSKTWALWLTQTFAWCSFIFVFIIIIIEYWKGIKILWWFSNSQLHWAKNLRRVNGVWFWEWTGVSSSSSKKSRRKEACIILACGVCA